MPEALIITLAPLSGAVLGTILGRLGANKALKTCQEAKKACNDQLHAIKADVLTAQARVVALEYELERHLRRTEAKNARQEL